MQFWDGKHPKYLLVGGGREEGRICHILDLHLCFFLGPGEDIILKKEKRSFFYHLHLILSQKKVGTGGGTNIYNLHFTFSKHIVESTIFGPLCSTIYNPNNCKIYNPCMYPLLHPNKSSKNKPCSIPTSQLGSKAVHLHDRECRHHRRDNQIWDCQVTYPLRSCLQFQVLENS